ncbi:MAG: CsgG/HfaB family protein [Spirochaetota bacterium]
MRTTRIAIIAALCLTTIVTPQEKMVILDSGEVLKGLVKETDTTVRIKTKRFGVLEVEKSAVKKIIDVDDNASLAAERDLSATGMTAGPSRENKISVNDFTVTSSNPDLKPLGKGFSELIAYEVKKSPKVRLVERERRNELFKEMELSLTGAVAEKDQVKAGRILACDYIVFGEIVDMAGSLMLSLRMTKVESGEVVWRKQLTEPGKNYPYISAFFAKDILTTLKLDVDRSIDESITSKKAMNENAVVKLAKGIDAYDRKDTAKAKEELAAARTLDPENQVVKAFINKLSGNVSKFKVLPERYSSFINPAYLGVAKTDRYYLSGSWLNLEGQDSRNYQRQAVRWVSPTYGVNEAGYTMNFGAFVPFVKGLGASFEYKYGNMNNRLVDTNLMGYAGAQEFHTIIVGGLGLAFNDNFSIGIQGGYTMNSVSLVKGTDIAGVIAISNFIAQNPTAYLEPVSGYGHLDTHTWNTGVGLIIKNSDDTLIFDTYVNYDNGMSVYYRNSDTNFITYRMPVFNENTLIIAMNEKKTFIVLKECNEFYYSQNGFVGKFIPAVEQWLFDTGFFSLSARAACEAVISTYGGTTRFGIGGMAGLTPRFKLFDRTTIEIDVNYTFRSRPSMLVPGMLLPEHVIFYTFSIGGLFIDR